ARSDTTNALHDDRHNDHLPRGATVGNGGPRAERRDVMKTMATIGAVLVAGGLLGGCESAETKAVKRSTDLIEGLKQRSFPGLPATLTGEQALELEKEHK